MTDLVQKLVGALERLLNSDPDGAIATASEDDLTLAANDMDADPVIREQAASVLQARAALTAAKAGGWVAVASEPMPRDGGSYLVADAVRGMVAPHIRGVIHNNPGTNWDWQYGEAVTHWQPLPNPPKEQA